MTNRLATTSLLALAALAGCAATPSSPTTDANFGNAVRALVQQQTLDPQAGQRNAQAVPAADGRSVGEAGERYVDSFRKPPPTTIVNVLGGAAAQR